MITPPQRSLRPRTPPRQVREDDEYGPQSSVDPRPLRAGGDSGRRRGGRVPRGGSPGPLPAPHGCVPAQVGPYLHDLVDLMDLAIVLFLVWLARSRRNAQEL